ncbi:ComE operon protein 1 [Natranaerofaba carboxydovora]|nr:ComE operon protein 1 [Natranaerofaba carboxydovora]
MVLLGVCVLSMMFLLIPFFIEGDDDIKYGEITLDSEQTLMGENSQSEIEEDEVTSEFEIELDNFENEPEYAVYVSGKVKVPGVYYLEPGSRVYEALREAGGALENARLDHINLAAEINDGDHIHIPSKDDEIQEAEMSSNTVSKSSENSLIDINQADYLTLKDLPGIGPARAETIIDYRERNGHFSKTEDVMKVPGIGQGIFEQIRDRITT